MAVQRIFLGWQEPGLHLAARWLFARRGPVDGVWDLSPLLIAVPGARAGRRLLEILARQGHGLALTPPAIVTVGGLPERLLGDGASGQVASALRALLLRAAALRQADAACLEAVCPRRPDDEDWPGWLNLAQELAGLQEALAGAGKPVAAVAELAATLPDFQQEERWQALSLLQEGYEETLAGQGLIDPAQARLQAAANPQLPGQSELILLATAELSPLLRTAIDNLAAPVTALIHAPESCAAGFDERGGLISEYWAGQQVAIAPEQLTIVDRPRDQGEALLHWLGRDGALRPDDVTVGVGSQDEVGMLQRTLELAGAPARYPGGTPLALTRVGMLLAALARWVGSWRRHDFAALLRHPDLHPLILQMSAGVGEEDEERGSDGARAAGGEGRGSRAVPGAESYLTMLDEYICAHLPATLGPGSLLGADGAALQGVLAAVLELLPERPAELRPVGRWAEQIAQLLQRVYQHQGSDGRLLRHEEEQSQLIRALEAAAGVLGELAALPAEDPATPRVTFAQALALTSSLGQEQAIAPESGSSAVELLGYLELQLDDAPLLVLTSVNEGCIPAAGGSDCFLPDGLRSKLGLPANQSRYARDLMMLSAMLASRKQVLILASRLDGQENHRAPSRLLLACGEEEKIARVRAFYQENAGENAGEVPGAGDGGGRALPWEYGRVSRFVIPLPAESAALTSLSVTGFRDYLQCPYRFYLKHVLRLRGCDDQASEMAGNSFGTLAHQVLSQFAASELVDSSDGRRIAKLLEQLLRDMMAERFGSKPAPAVALQCAQLNRRLASFALWQAQQVRDGWRIVTGDVESKFSAQRDVDGQLFTIKGQIDRIDRYQGAGPAKVRIVDYKLGDKVTHPEAAHRKNQDGEQRWVDLQLPLYALLAQREIGAAKSELGYVQLPKDLHKIGFQAAEWAEADLDSAWAQADTVIRKLRQGCFWPPAQPPDYADEFTAICMDGSIYRQAALAAVVA